jgi:hypothetical protein
MHRKLMRQTRVKSLFAAMDGSCMLAKRKGADQPRRKVRTRRGGRYAVRADIASAAHARVATGLSVTDAHWSLSMMPTGYVRHCTARLSRNARHRHCLPCVRRVRGLFLDSLIERPLPLL